MSTRKDITGQRFGYLVALYDTGESDYLQRAIWHMRCDACGNEADISVRLLDTGKKTHCGCLGLHGGRQCVSLVGQTFSRLTVTNQYLGRGGYWCHCKCSCGNECDVRKSSLVNHLTKSCGCYKQELMDEAQARRIEKAKLPPKKRGRKKKVT